MPKSKSKRTNRRYHPRPARVGPFYGPEQEQLHRDRLNDVALYVECALPAGTLTDQQIDWVEDYLNWGLGILLKRQGHLEQSELNEAGPVLLAGRKALTAVINRKQRRGSAYIASGDEIRAISSAFAIVVPLIRDAMQISPRRALNEFFWSHQTAIRNHHEHTRRERTPKNGLSQ